MINGLSSAVTNAARTGAKKAMAGSTNASVNAGMKAVKAKVPNEELVKIIQEGGDKAKKEAAEQLIEQNKGFVQLVAKGLGRLGANRKDVMQEGYIELLRAAENFNPQNGNNFLTYAGACIRGGMKKAKRNTENLIHKPQSTLSQTRIAEDLAQKIEQSGRKPTEKEMAEIAGKLNTTSKSLQEREACINSKTVSFDEVNPQDLSKKPCFSHDKYDEEILLEDVIGDKSGNVEEIATSEVYTKSILDNYETVREPHGIHTRPNSRNPLNPEEADMFQMRYGINNPYEKTIDEVAQEFNTSREHVRETINNAIKKLREYFQK